MWLTERGKQAARGSLGEGPLKCWVEVQKHINGNLGGERAECSLPPLASDSGASSYWRTRHWDPEQEGDLSFAVCCCCFLAKTHRPRESLLSLPPPQIRKSPTRPIYWEIVKTERIMWCKCPGQGEGSQEGKCKYQQNLNCHHNQGPGSQIPPDHER